MEEILLWKFSLIILPPEMIYKMYELLKCADACYWGMWCRKIHLKKTGWEGGSWPAVCLQCFFSLGKSLGLPLIAEPFISAQCKQQEKEDVSILIYSDFLNIFVEHSFLMVAAVQNWSLKKNCQKKSLASQKWAALGMDCTMEMLHSVSTNDVYYLSFLPATPLAQIICIYLYTGHLNFQAIFYTWPLLSKWN